ncbi:distal tail protein Dit [Bacillus cereus group sp. Bce033]|uniref:distal tail protein Dit n=1 Tax=Bacillus TaxID=1386 RepID=UPI000F4F7B0E|nr:MULTISPECIES: distal tail protein Dit [Bacillus]AYY27349.1 phage tail family protein [Bacillus sp. FDAARGOS_527]MDA1596184.1 phage tail family protein [Bacillus cereus group sp. TH217LC]
MLIFNGIHVENYFENKYEKGFFMVNDIRGRGILSDEIYELSVPRRAGSYYLGKRTPKRVIEIDFSLKGVSLLDIRKRIDELNKLLYTDNPVEIKFTDEPEYTYYGVKENVEENLEKSNIHQGTITLVCLFPYKVGDLKTYDFKQEWSTEITSRFVNNGSVESPALIEINVKKQSTFLDVWFGDYPLDRNYFRLGYPLAVQETPVQERERVLWDEMTSPIGWTPVTGQVEEMKGTGSFKSRDGYALYCEDYGQGSDFHGAIAKKNIPGGPLQDFEMEAWVRLKSKSIGEMGRVEVLLLDDASNIVARINMNDLYWDAEITKAYMRLGNAGTPNSIRKLVDTNGTHPNTFNQFYGRLRIARRGKEWSVYVARFKDGTEIDDASLPVKWIDETGNPMTNRKVAQVMIAICKLGDNPPVDILQIDDLKIWKVNSVGSNARPYIFDPGDKVVIDTESAHVTVNGKDVIHLKDVFSDFPMIIRGNNRIDIMPPEVGKAAVSFREMFR